MFVENCRSANIASEKMLIYYYIIHFQGYVDYHSAGKHDRRPYTHHTIYNLDTIIPL